MTTGTVVPKCNEVVFGLVNGTKVDLAAFVEDGDFIEQLNDGQQTSRYQWENETTDIVGLLRSLVKGNDRSGLEDAQ